MNNFYYYNPTKIIFGKGMLPRITSELLDVQKVLLLYGQGSIKKNGLYEKTLSVLHNASISFVEFGGIEPNPDFNTALKAIELVRKEGVDFILAIGGGSVIDAAKFIALCAYSNDPWGVITATTPPPETILSIGSVCTVPGSGSEMNNSFVLSKRSDIYKRPFSHIKLYPKFSLLDPENTYSLSKHQSALGIVDAFVHILEQYITYSVAAPLHERQSEAILLT
ncbi:MAG: iron-containing alcohol dehydrogenase, partial [Campylobacterales bacterium]|nr:iron-containing alcohol dehydrogenase [Campylobacterales bacterium]